MKYSFPMSSLTSSCTNAIIEYRFNIKDFLCIIGMCKLGIAPFLLIRSVQIKNLICKEEENIVFRNDLQKKTTVLGFWDKKPCFGKIGDVYSFLIM